MQSLKSKNYERYKKIKNGLNIQYKGYNLQPLIARDISVIQFYKKLPKIKSIVRFFIVHKENNFKQICNSDMYLFSLPYFKRKDHEALVNSVYEEVKGSKMLYEHSRKWVIRINLNHIFKSFTEIVQIANLLSFKEIIYYWASICYYKNYLSELERNHLAPIKIKAFIGFNSSTTPDSIWTVFFNKYDVPTYSLQHGLYLDFKDFIGGAITNYENLTANKLLCWGNKTLQAMEEFGIDSSRLIVAGHPKYKKVESSIIKQSFKNGIVLLGAVVYDSGNELLLRLLSEYQNKYNTKFTIKMHPRLSSSKYESLCKKLNLHLIDKDALIKDIIASDAYDTTSYYESLVFGLLSLRYSFNENSELYGLTDKFESISDLQTIISEFKKKKQFDLQREVHHVLEEVFNIGKSRYGEIFPN